MLVTQGEERKGVEAEGLDHAEVLEPVHMRPVQLEQLDGGHSQVVVEQLDQLRQQLRLFLNEYFLCGGQLASCLDLSALLLYSSSS